MTRDPAASPLSRSLAIGLRILALIAFVLVASWVSHVVRASLDFEMMPMDAQQMRWMILVATVTYIGLLAIPFVPGAEIGIALMSTFGADVALTVYAATVLAMLLSYAVGRLLPITVLARVLAALRLRRAAALVRRAAPMPRDGRLQVLLEGAPPGIVALALHHRYAALALALNIPGNAVIGGGGGIMMVAGLSGIFSPVRTILTVAIAVAPVPLAVLVLGA
ncbi:hypothetical protein ILP92_15925 [Maribius pontilimi]|uniref:Uncharacterized protein n=1 Tax=Palleronia pontilimi TaxID=1964209 RepID=A0A934MB13_9RHOB|nr:hypothetical protein [Palleronia pontilimi]MBJ3764237.1 hypothetical protein [Palleronia pontilimi]